MGEIDAIFLPDTDYISVSSGAPSPDTSLSESTDILLSPSASLDHLQGAPLKDTPVDPLYSFDPDNWENWMQWDGIDLLGSPGLPDVSVPQSQAPYFQSTSASTSIPESRVTREKSVDAMPEPSLMTFTAPSTGLANSDFQGRFYQPATAGAYTPGISPRNNDFYESNQISHSNPSRLSISSLVPSDDVPNKKRKSSATDDVVSESTNRKRLPTSKAAHNIVEKRYRMNINEKITALRDSLPNFRPKQGGCPSIGQLENDDEDRGSGQKINKAAVLSEAISYIRQSEERLKKHNEDMAMMRVQLDVFRTLAAAKSSETPQEGVNREGTFDQGYPATVNRPPLNDNTRPAGRVSAGRVGYVNRLMVGSLAGLMVMQGLGESEQQSNTRGLFSLPAEFIWQIGRSLHSLGLSSAPELTFLLFKFIVLLGAVIFIISPSFFDSKPEKSTKSIPHLELKTSPPLGSLVEVRRSAWLTAIQTVWVPERSPSKQLAAHLLKFVELSIRRTVGSHVYARLTGVTEEQEVARARAWEIALDAQLTGGDAEINLSRLALTMLASATLPVTPYRLMLKALHIHILRREVAHSRPRGHYIYRGLTMRYARYQWEKARKLQAQISTDPSPSDALPDHLAALLHLDIDTVMQDTIVRRACDLAWNRPTIDEGVDRVDGMSNIINDPIIGSPLDALSAWCSCFVLRKALVNFVGVKTCTISTNSETDFQNDAHLALKISPARSLTQNYSLVARAVLVTENRGANIAAALQALPSAAPSYTPPELRMALQCAMAVALLQNPQYKSEAVAVIERVEKIELPHDGLGLLGFTAAYNLLVTAFEDKTVAGDMRRALENAATTLKLWVGGERGGCSGLERGARGEVAVLCIKVFRWLVGMSLDDPGYGSMSE